MAGYRKDTPDFFEDSALDPIKLAIGPEKVASKQDPVRKGATGKTEEKKSGRPAAKKKAGFYLSTDLIDRFTRKFHELKLAGIKIDNKSTLMEIAVSFALDDIDKGNESRVLNQL
jgi:hypothetical protein